MLRLADCVLNDSFLSWDDVRALFEELYGSGNKPKETRQKIRQAITQLERHSLFPADVDERTIAAYTRASTQRGNSPATTNSVLGHMPAITKYLAGKKVIPGDPFQLGLSFRRKEQPARRRRNKHHSIADIARILQLADQEWGDAKSLQQRFNAGRTRALVWLLSHLGTRATETLCLRRDRIAGGFVDVLHEDQPEGWCKTRGSERRIAIPAEAQRRLDEWMTFSEPFGYQRLFPCLRKDSPWLHGLSQHRPLGRVKALGARAGVNGVTMVSLRHTWQTHAEGAWAFTGKEIQAVVGHSNEQTQRCYQHEDDENMMRMMKRVKY